MLLALSISWVII